MNKTEEEFSASNDYQYLKYIGVLMSLLAVPLAAWSVFLDDGVRVLGVTVTPQVLMVGVPLLALCGLTLAVWVEQDESKK